jgi:DNA polymerase elongation subunit (family B)
MIYCYTVSFAISLTKTLRMSMDTASDKMSFKGGFMLDPKAGCYKC